MPDSRMAVAFSRAIFRDIARKTADLTTGDRFGVKHRSYGIDDNHGRSVVSAR
jgi:hypothetical protein